MAKYRKKPVVVDAFQWSIKDPYPSPGGIINHKTGTCLFYVITIHGDRAYLADGDWIITEPDGIHFYPCKLDIFEATYEPEESVADAVSQTPLSGSDEQRDTPF